MKRRYALFGMTAVLAMSLAIPAFGGPSNPVSSTFASAKSTAKKALNKAKAADKAAKAAQSSADAAQSTANNARTTANSAQAAADNAQTAANAAQTAANNAQSTADTAQTAANNAQNSANSKFGSTDFNFGTTSPNNGDDIKTAFAGCDSGDFYTGGGHTLGGSTPEAVTVTSSAPYLNNNWAVTAEEIPGAGATNWSLQANVMCVGPS